MSQKQGKRVESQQNAVPKSVKIALRVAERVRFMDTARYDYVGSVLPPLALALEKQGIKVTENLLWREVKKGDENLKTLCQQFKNSAKKPAKSFNDAIRDLYKPLKEVLKAVETEDMDLLRQLYRRHGARLFTHDLKKDILAKSIELDKWKPIEYLIENHNFRLEDNLTAIVGAISKSGHYHFIRRIGDFYTIEKNNKTSSPFIDVIAPALLSFVLVDDPHLVTTREVALDILENVVRSWPRKNIKPKILDWETEKKKIDALEYLIEKNTNISFESLIQSFDVTHTRKTKDFEQIKGSTWFLEKGITEDVQVLKAMIYELYFEETIKLFDETDPLQKAHKLMFAYLFVPDNRLSDYHNFLKTEEEIKVFSQEVQKYLNLFDIVRLQEIADQMTNQGAEDMSAFYDVVLMCSTKTIISLLVEKENSGDIERDLADENSYLNMHARADSPSVDMNIPLEFIYNDYKTHRNRKALRAGGLKQAYALFAKEQVLSEKALSYILKISFMGGDSESFKFFYEKFALDQKLKEDIFSFVIENFELFAENAEMSRDIEKNYFKKKECLSLMDNDPALKDFNVAGSVNQEILRHAFFFRFLENRNVSINYSKLQTTFLFNTLWYKELECLGDLAEFRQKIDLVPILIHSIGALSEEGPAFCHDFMSKCPVLTAEDYNAVHTFMREEYLPRFTRYEELEIFDGYGGNKFIAFMEEQMTAMGADFEKIDANKIAKISNGDESAWFKRWGKKAPRNLAEFSPYLYVPDLCEYIGKLMQQEENWDAHGEIKLNLLDNTESIDDVIFSDHPNEDKALREFDRFAFVAAAFFQDEKSFVEYTDRWAQVSKRPLLSCLSKFALPHNDRIMKSDGNGKFVETDERMNWKDWRDAVLQCGPRMLSLVKYANYMASPKRSDDGKRWSIENTMNALCPLLFDKYEVSPEFSELTLRYDLGVRNYHEGIELIKKFQDNMHISIVPDVSFDADTLGIPNTQFYKLPEGDIRGLVLGHFVDCCQYIGGGAAYAAKHGFESTHGGFYVVEKQSGKKKEIVGMSWAWIDENNVLVLDSLETLGGRVSAREWQTIISLFAQEVEQKEENGIRKIAIGQGGATPVLPFQSLELGDLKPREGVEVKDSKRSYLAWERKDGRRALRYG